MTNLDHFRKNIPVCRECSNWGPHPKTRRVGCLLYLPACPCTVEDDLKKGKGCKNKDNPRFGPSEQAMSKCPECNAPMPDGYCEACEDAQDHLEDCLSICRTDVCLKYDSSDGRDRCLMLPRPCRLKQLIRGGWVCPKGHHDNVSG
jgi:hypothetical protein